MEVKREDEGVSKLLVLGVAVRTDNCRRPHPKHISASFTRRDTLRTAIHPPFN